MNKSQTVNLAKDMVGLGKTVQLDIMQRFMTAKELQSFTKAYRANSRHSGSRNRFVKFSTPITEENKEMLRLYFNETFTGKDIEEKTGDKMQNFTHKVYGIALKLCFEKQRQLGL